MPQTFSQDDLCSILKDQFGSLWVRLLPSTQETLIQIEFQREQFRRTPNIDFSGIMHFVFKIVETELNQGLFKWLRSEGIKMKDRLTLGDMQRCLQSSEVQATISGLPEEQRKYIRQIPGQIKRLIYEHERNDKIHADPATVWELEHVSGFVYSKVLPAVINATPDRGLEDRVG